MKVNIVIQQKRGFTLLEAVIAIGLFCLLLSASLQLWKSVQSHIWYDTSQKELVENAMGIATIIKHEFKMASKVSYEGVQSSFGTETKKIQLEELRGNQSNAWIKKTLLICSEPSAARMAENPFYISKGGGKKYEAGVYLERLHILNLGKGTYWITLEMRYDTFYYRHDFSVLLSN